MASKSSGVDDYGDDDGGNRRCFPKRQYVESSNEKKTNDDDKSSDDDDNDDMKSDDSEELPCPRVLHITQDSHCTNQTATDSTLSGSNDVVQHVTQIPLSGSMPFHSVGGCVSTSSTTSTTATVTVTGSNLSAKPLGYSDDAAHQLLQALVQRDTASSCDRTEPRGASQIGPISVQVNLTQTNVAQTNTTINPAALAIGGTVNVTPPAQQGASSEPPRSQPEIQRLRYETQKTIEKWTAGMVYTECRQKVLDKISQGRKWITITGSPGEGKTTTGYLVLKQLYRLGREVFDIKNPNDYFCVKNLKQPVIMLNDIFGSLHFDICKVKKWEEVLSDILALKEHRMKEEIDNEKNHPVVVLISRSSVLREASHHLGRFKDLVLHEDCQIDITHGLGWTFEDKMKIWKHHATAFNINIDEKIVRDVCKMSDLPHGFPHCCRLFASMYSENKNLFMGPFFCKPLRFLNQTMESLLKEPSSGSLLRELLKHDGSLDIYGVATCGHPGRERMASFINNNAAKILDNSLLITISQRY